MRNTLLSGVTALALLSALAGCSDSGDEPRAEPSGQPASSSPSTTNTPTDEAVAEPIAESEGGVFLNPEATYVDYDPPRELTLVEQALMRAPGPYSGDAFDVDSVVAAVEDSGATTPREYAEAIIEQIHGDYAATAQQIIEFDPHVDGVEAPEDQASSRTVGRNHFALVLDASGSMAESAGAGTRMDAAKTAINAFVDNLPQGSTVSLRVYGHAGSGSDADKAISCGSSENVYSGDPAGVRAALSAVEPVGWTPLALGVRQARQDIPEDATDAIVYVVTDGLETCGGDPVAAARSIRTTSIKPVVNVIGFQVSGSTAQLRRLAQIGGGRYTDVASGAELEAYWVKDAQRMMDAWSRWQLEATTSITDQTQGNLDDASAPPQILMDAVDLEWTQGQEVLAALETAGILDFGDNLEVWDELFRRHNTLWSWAYDHWVGNWTTAYDQGMDTWMDAYEQGGMKWTEYYRKVGRR